MLCEILARLHKKGKVAQQSAQGRDAKSLSNQAWVCVQILLQPDFSSLDTLQHPITD